MAGWVPARTLREGYGAGGSPVCERSGALRVGRVPCVARSSFPRCRTYGSRPCSGRLIGSRSMHAALRAAAQDLRASAAPLPPLLAAPAEGRPAPRAAQDQQARRARRYARYQEICGLHEQGITQGEIARGLGIGRATVRRFLRADGFPEQAPRPRRHTVVGPFEAYLRQRWEAGCHNARHLYDEIRQQGYPGTVSRVRHFLAHWRHEPGPAGPTPRHRMHRAPSPVPPSLTSPRRATWLLLRPAERLGDEERAALQAVQQVCPEVVAVQCSASTTCWRTGTSRASLAGSVTSRSRATRS